MTARDFCYWLQGYFEVSQASSRNAPRLSSDQIDTIRRHLALVFAHDIDPKAGGPDVQKKLDSIHPPNGHASPYDGADVQARC